MKKYSSAVKNLEQMCSANANHPRLKRLYFLLALAGHPERTLRHSIHITGTSGKGTVTMMLAESLHASGQNVGAYTSPHVTTTIERFWHNGRLMPPETYVELVRWITPLLRRCDRESPWGIPSYFETEVVIALEWFRHIGIEWAVIEVGCGGRYDATNVIPPPDVAIITNVGRDHFDLLGKTLPAIARTKAGIIKHGSQVFTSEKGPAIRKILRSVGTKNRMRSFHVVRGEAAELTRAVGATIGLPSHAIEKGIRRAKLPARFEIMQRHPLVVLDGAHNPDKIAFLVREWKRRGLPPPRVLFAVAENKEWRPMLDLLAPMAAEIVATTFSNMTRTCVDPKMLKMYGRAIRSPRTALASLLRNEKEPVLITGSFFLAGQLRTRWIPERTILKRLTSFG